MRQQKYRNLCIPPFLMLKAVQSSAKREMALELYSDPQETRGLSLCVMRIENKAPLSLPLSLSSCSLFVTRSPTAASISR